MSVALGGEVCFAPRALHSPCQRLFGQFTMLIDACSLIMFGVSWPFVESPAYDPPNHRDYHLIWKFQRGTDATGLTTASKKHLVTDQVAVFDVLGVGTG